MSNALNINQIIHKVKKNNVKAHCHRWSHWPSGNMNFTLTVGGQAD